VLGRAAPSADGAGAFAAISFTSGADFEARGVGALDRAASEAIASFCPELGLPEYAASRMLAQEAIKASETIETAVRTTICLAVIATHYTAQLPPKMRIFHEFISPRALRTVRARAVLAFFGRNEPFTVNDGSVVDQLSKVLQNVKTLYVSGYTAGVIGVQGVLDAGVNFLEKPYRFDDLASKVRELLSSFPRTPSSHL